MRCVQRVGQPFAGLVMAREKIERLAVPAEILHELAGKFDRIPFHAVDAADRRQIHLGKHVMQAMAEFVEQGQYVVVRQQRRRLGGGRREIAGQEGDRQFQRRTVAETRAADVHPGAAALAGARIEIDIAARDDATVAIAHVEIAHVRMPDIHAVTRAQWDAIQAFDQLEQAVDHCRQPGNTA